MFSNLTQKIDKTFRKLFSKGTLTAGNIQEALHEVRTALLEADTAHEVVDAFLQQIHTKVVGLEVARGLNASQTFIKSVNEALTDLLGHEQSELSLRAQPPVVILMVGLQGSGKTTSTAKIGRMLREKQHKSVMAVSCDVYRPAAIEQLQTLCAQNQIQCAPSSPQEKPLDIAKRALELARKQYQDVLLVDSAGRLHIDEVMMDEVAALAELLNPHEILFVIDGMMGQDAARTAKAFHERLALTGVVVTKLDGDARAGSVLSVRYLTGCPIKFVGMGEKADALEPFYPDRMASRILGMGDMLSLIEDLQHHVDEEDAMRLQQKIERGKGFDLEDFRKQIVQMQNMGGLSSVMEKMPGMAALPSHLRDKAANDKSMGKTLAMLQSMTMYERKNPVVIRGRRKIRITKGSGTTVRDLEKMLKQFEDMQKMMKQLQKMGGMGALGNMLKGGGLGGLFSKK